MISFLINSFIDNLDDTKETILVKLPFGIKLNGVFVNLLLVVVTEKCNSNWL